jgi:hypothetical protein
MMLHALNRSVCGEWWIMKWHALLNMILENGSTRQDIPHSLSVHCSDRISEFEVEI